MQRDVPPYTISTDRALLDTVAIHDYLSNHADWSLGITLEQVVTSMKHSHCYGIYLGDKQVGFARIITDFVSLAYLCDVYILADHRGHGLSIALLDLMLADPCLQGLRRWLLRTTTAADLYKRFGFAFVDDPALFMELRPSK
jgi:N-acetylglutamate synthase-like GNAT family acetyltransferase